MPALVLFGRKWQIGSDDLVLPSIFDLLIRLTWLLAVAIIFWRNENDINDCTNAKIFLIGFLGIAHISVILDATLIQNSRYGSIMETEKRKYVPFFLYLRITSEVVSLGWNTWGTVWFWSKNGADCEQPYNVDTYNLIYCLLIFHWTLLLFQLWFLAYCFDPLGGSKTQTQPYKDASIYYNEFPNADVPFGKSKYSKRWENCWKFMCCSWMCRHKRRRDEVKDAFKEIAKIFATQLGGEDLVHSDIVAGMVILAARHSINCQKIRQAKADRSRQLVKHVSMDVIKEEPFDDNPKETVNKDFVTGDGWRSPKYLAYFVKYICAPFGWAAVVLDRSNPVSRPYNICSFCSCLAGRRYPFEVVGDNCCFSNTAGLVDMLQLEMTDIIHVSFKNEIFHVPFFVALDHETKSIVLGIRGSFALNDAIVDFAGWPMPIPGCPASFKAHHGILRTSLKLKEKLDGLQIIPKLLHGHPGYQLIITGHSLGAACGTILSILWKKQFPSIKCYAYAPPGGLLSKGAAEFCNSFVTSITYGHDIIIRFGILQFERLKQDLITALRECEVPKYQIIVRGLLCCFRSKKKFQLIGRTESTKSTQKLEYNNSDGEVSIIMPANNTDKNVYKSSGNNVCSTQACPETRFPYIEGMYPPGKIMYISKTHKFNLSYSTWREPVAKYTWRWADRSEFDDIIISKRMILDHAPFAMSEALHYLSKKKD